MTRPARSFPPPENAAARYDAVLRRGRALRRRQQMVRVAGVGGATLALLLVVVLLAGNSRSEDQDVVDSTTTTTSVTTSTVPEHLTVAVDEPSADRSSVQVHATDPTQPDSPDSRICLTVRVSPDGVAGAAAAEGVGCWSLEDGENDTPIVVHLTGAEVGCTAVASNGTDDDGTNDGTLERGDDGATTSVPSTTLPVRSVDHDFTLQLPSGLARGDYVVEVAAVSGIGDGCTTTGVPPGMAESAEGQTELTIG